MCHEYFSRDWAREPDETEDEADDDIPGFLNEEASEDVEIVTDGGDEE